MRAVDGATFIIIVDGGNLTLGILGFLNLKAECY